MAGIFSALLVLFLAVWPVWAHVPQTVLKPKTQEVQDECYCPARLLAAPYAPSFAVRDTINKYGRYVTKTKTITLKDLIKFHGHFCGGLVESRWRAPNGL